jgi:hypothetical protein
MNVSRLWGCRCAFGPAETFDVVRLFCSFPIVRVLLRPHPTFVRRPSSFTCIYSPFPLLKFPLPPDMLLIYFSFFFSFFFCFHLSVASCPHGSRRPFVFLLFFLLSILGVVLLLLTKLTSSFTLRFPFFCFIYFACLRISWVCLLARSKGETGHTQSHKFSHIFWFVPPSTWCPFFSLVV